MFLIPLFLLGLRVGAADAEHAFKTGVLRRVVRIHVSNFDPRPSETSVTEVIGDGRRRATELLDAVRRTTVNDPPVTVEVTDWRQLFTLSAWVYALTHDQDAAALERLPLAEFFNRIAPDAAGPTADPYVLARRAVGPFRTNWLYQAHDAVVLDRVETYLAESLKLMSPAGEYTRDRLLKLSLADFDTATGRFYVLARRASDIWNRTPGQPVDVARIRGLGDFHVTDSWDVLMMLLRQELFRFRQGEVISTEVLFESIKALAKFGRLVGPFRVEFESFREEVMHLLSAHPFSLTLDQKLRWAQHVMNRRAGALESISDLRTQLTCVAQLAPHATP